MCLTVFTDVGVPLLLLCKRSSTSSMKVFYMLKMLHAMVFKCNPYRFIYSIKN